MSLAKRCLASTIFSKYSVVRKNRREFQRKYFERQAFALVNSSNDSSPLVSAGEQLSSRQTICASPVRGACDINSKAHFVDGVVDDAHLLLQENRISTLLSGELSRFPNTNCLIRNPNTDSKIAGAKLHHKYPRHRFSRKPEHDQQKL